DVIFAGDLMNQCTSSAYGVLGFGTPYFGIYGACSTFTEGTALASMMINAGYYEKCAVVTSSHFCSAERQFRFPIEYGGQRTPTAQWTVTGAGAILLSRGGNGPYVKEVMPGIPIDKGITDSSNMGAAMAPAAIDTFTRYFDETGKSPDDFDLILTGDLGREGHGIMCEFMRAAGYDMYRNYNDCGLLIFNAKAQDVHAGGSGCGCAATVFSSYILNNLKLGKINDVLFAATGALMSPDALKQGCSIPGIAHLVRITNGR
ncbi:MAG: stage V sporulation protein AD, partial [Clostridia bacterium]|nr:stage V sporulation protein AD [Clostridia bacterium]